MSPAQVGQDFIPRLPIASPISFHQRPSRLAQASYGKLNTASPCGSSPGRDVLCDVVSIEARDFLQRLLRQHRAISRDLVQLALFVGLEWPGKPGTGVPALFAAGPCPVSLSVFRFSFFCRTYAPCEGTMNSKFMVAPLPCFHKSFSKRACHLRLTQIPPMYPHSGFQAFAKYVQHRSTRCVHRLPICAHPPSFSPRAWWASSSQASRQRL